MAMKRGPYHKVREKNLWLIEKIKEIKSHHPFWGYRRVWAHLKFKMGFSVGKNRVYGIMKKEDLIVKRNLRLRAKRTKIRSKPCPKEPNLWWGIDMTKVMIEGSGWVYIVIVIDWYTKKVVGHYSDLQSKTQHWLEALNEGVNKQFPYGVREKNLHLMSDNGCQPTSSQFLKATQAMGITQAFTSYNNPKGNADTERFMRTMKEEFVWQKDWSSPIEFNQALNAWINDYNANYLHSTLGYKSPNSIEKNYGNTLLKKAC